MHGHVTLLSWTPDMEAMIASGGRISTMDGTADEIRAKSLAAGKEKNEKLIGKVLSSGHTSVLEHGYVNLAFENVSVLAEQFLIEFRLASFTVKSRRYVDFSGAGYVAPELPSPQAQALFDETVRELFRIYDELEAAGVPKEDARFVLPYCFCSNFFCSMNARELVHVMNELRYGRGKEIRELQELGESLFSQCEEKLPFLAVRKPGAYEKAPLPLRTGKLLEPEAQVTLLDGTQEPERLICRAAYLARGQQMPELTQREQTELLMAGKIVPNVADQPPLLQKLTAQMMTRRLHHVVIVEYERIPFVYKNGNVRITLDTNLVSSSDVSQFLRERIPHRPVMPLGQQLLEVKYDAYLPDFLYQSLQLSDLRQTAYSKYALCRRYTR